MKFAKLWSALFSAKQTKRRGSQSNQSFVLQQAAEVLELRSLLSSSTAAAVSLTIQGTAVTLASTDTLNPTFSVTRSGNYLVVTGTNNTQITYGTKTATSQSVYLPTAGSLTLNLGTGVDSVAVSGLGLTGNLTINGKSSGMANISISAGTSSVTIGGALQANLGSESATLNLFASGNGGGNLSITGAVNISESGAGTKQINVAGPLANNPSGGKLSIGGDFTVLDTGNGVSGLHIDDGITFGGKVSFDNSANTVNANSIQVYSNTNAYGATSIAGSLNLALSQSVYQSNSIVIEGWGNALAVAGAVNITGGGASDNIELANAWFETTTTINTGTNPSFGSDVLGIDGMRFDGATQITMAGANAKLNLGTNSNFVPTYFNSTLAASLTGPGAVVYLSNGTSTANQVVFKSTAAFTGGTTYGAFLAQGYYWAGSGKLTKTNFNTYLPAAVVPIVTATLKGSDLTLTASDGYNPSITITRSGTKVVITGANGTKITYGSTTLATQSITLATLRNLTVNLGTGIDTISVTGLSTTGNININGQTIGQANVSINAGTTNATIAGSIQANLGSEASTFGLFGSSNGGGNLTVSGSVSVTEAGAGNHQVNIYGPPANNLYGGVLTITGNVTVADNGAGASGLHIDDGVTFKGNLSYDNSSNSVNGDTIVMYSNSNAYGVTSIAGSLSLSMSQAVYKTNSLLIEGFGSPLTVTGAVSINSNGGVDNFELALDWFKSTTTINTGANPSFASDYIGVDGMRFDGAVVIGMSGQNAQLALGTNSTFVATYFNSTLAASLTGLGSIVYLSNATSSSSQVVFKSSTSFTGGTTYGTLVIQGFYSVPAGKLTKTNFN